MRARVRQLALPGADAQVAARFLATMAAWTLTCLAVIRLPRIEQGLVQSLIDVQRTVALWYGATPSTAILINASCSGADQMALCLGVTLAYPTMWARRLAGAAGGLLAVLVLNTIRIGTLLTVAESPRTLQVLHEYVWPVILVAAVVGYVLVWIRWTDGAPTGLSPELMRGAIVAVTLLVAYAALAPWTFTHPIVAAAGEWIARAGAKLLAFTGTTSVRGNILMTSRGAFQVTPECVLTPLIPLYLAAAAIWPRRMSRRVLALALAVPVFFALGVMRLLILAVPPYILATPIIVAHGFFQLVLGVLVVGGAALIRSRATGQSLAGPWLAGLTGAAAAAIVTAPWLNGLVAAGVRLLHVQTPNDSATLWSPGDLQGALVLLPAYQLALLTGVWLAARGSRDAGRYTGAVFSLLGLQVLMLVVVGAFEARTGMRLHPLVVRACAVGVPLIVVLFWMRDTTRPAEDDRAYRQFWHDVGADFPTLTGAPSTRYYRANEIRLLTEQLPRLSGCTVLKTDLWDEAKNTEILQWVAAQGARTYGIDISGPIVEQARRGFNGLPLGATLADVRVLPFAEGSFDAIYSMGTVEHFPETQQAVDELARVLKPGGRLILGVPNLHDPFLRPLLVWLLLKVNRYGYGAEQAFSRRALRAMLERAGLEVETETGILFMPGWLRMLDLWGHTRWAPLTRLTAPLVGLFEGLDRRFPELRRHGYLLASVGIKREIEPTTASPDDSGSTPSRRFATGREYAVDAYGCRGATLQSRADLERLLARIIGDLGLRTVSEPVWHVFPGPAGLTGLVMLAESHLSVHTFPEHGYAAFNLYCCRPVAEWPWQTALNEALGARRVVIHTLARGGEGSATPPGFTTSSH